MAEPRPNGPIVHLGFDSCGGEALARLFRTNDLSALVWEKGALAREIVYRDAANRRAPSDWQRADLLAELHHHDTSRAPAFGFERFEWLDRQLPGATFVLTLRDVEGWAADRLGATTLGRSARETARRLGCAPSDLPEIWIADWDRHITRVRAHFADRPNYLEIDLEGLDWHALRERLARGGVTGLDRLPPRPAERVLDFGAVPAAGRVMDLLTETAPIISHGGPIDQALVDELLPFCLGVMRHGTEGVADPGRSFSDIYAYHDGAGGVFGRSGMRAEIDFDPLHDQFVARPVGGKIDRTEAVLNQLHTLGRLTPVQIDMADARHFGAAGRPQTQYPTLTYNRREGAVNVVLWPLPGFHEIGTPAFALPYNPDSVSFDEKEDRVMWRGNLSGVSRRPGGANGPGAIRLAGIIGDEQRSPLERAAAARAMRTIPRLAVLERYGARTDMDLGLVMSLAIKRAGEMPQLDAAIRPRLSIRQMLSCRWQLCLAGYDVGTNFVWAANSNSVVLKEEAGWEVYFSALFRPWEHYVPLAPAAADLEERLDWARANPALTAQMSAESRHQVHRLADYPTQRALMRAIAESIPAIPPPFGS
ncbi:MAG: hypothetical protein DI498_09770 [Paracoccus denitrificans]|nr:MAG: hypothetical protein DI498_09770 [Paracoccus denitrificans]PZO83990.1 MAG: hypothetical protein DI633_09770 [Paracoccus denitrificans]